MKARDGKMRLTDCATRETLLRLVQSIPSKNAEPFKLWLASAGESRERLEKKAGLKVVSRDHFLKKKE
jgi:hypothetical protein